MDLFSAIFYTVLSLTAGGIVFGIIKYPKIELPVKLLVFSLALSFASDLISYFLAKNYIYTYPVTHFYNLFAIILYSLIVYTIIRSRLIKVIIFAFTTLVEVVWFMHLIMGKTLNEIWPISKGLAGITLAIYSLFIFYEIFKFSDDEHLERSSTFWIASGLLFYNAGTLFLFLLQISTENSNLWIIHNSIYAVYLIISIIAIWINSRRTSLLL